MAEKEAGVVTEMEAAVRSTLDVPGRVVYLQRAGSASYGLEVEGSDVDYLGVFVAPTRALLGLGEVRETAATPAWVKPDATLHEAGKFARLLLKGNPSVLETLFVEDGWEGHAAWSALRAARRHFLSRRAVEQILGYCEGQMRRLGEGRSVHSSGGAPGPKWAYHMLRLVGYAEDVAAGREIRVRAEGATRDRLLAVRRGEFDSDGLVAEVRARAGAVRAARWDLPEEGDRDVLEGWLLWLRREVGEW